MAPQTAAMFMPRQIEENCAANKEVFASRESLVQMSFCNQLREADLARDCDEELRLCSARQPVISPPLDDSQSSLEETSRFQSENTAGISAHVGTLNLNKTHLEWFGE